MGAGRDLDVSFTTHQHDDLEGRSVDAAAILTARSIAVIAVHRRRLLAALEPRQQLLAVGTRTETVPDMHSH